MNRHTSNQDSDFTELEDVLGDALDVFGRNRLDEDEVLESRKFGLTEMEDTLGDALDEMDDHEW